VARANFHGLGVVDIHELLSYHCDNRSALKLVSDDNYHVRTVHSIDIRYQVLLHPRSHNRVDNRRCLARAPRIFAEDMTSDILTKLLSRWKIST
jgi:hypothetical protein